MSRRIDPEFIDKVMQDHFNIPAPSQSLSLPLRAIPKAEVPATAKNLSDGLREFTDGLTAYVMLKQAEQIIKSALEQTADHAMLKLTGKEMEVFGATVSRRSLKEYQYNDPTIDRLEKEIEANKTIIDERKKFMRLIKTPQIDSATGEEIQPAKLTRDGETLMVKFK